MKHKITLQEFAEKLDWEGGLDEMRSWCGEKARTDNSYFNEKWTVYCRAAEDVINLLPPVMEECEDE